MVRWHVKTRRHAFVAQNEALFETGEVVLA